MVECAILKFCGGVGELWWCVVVANKVRSCVVMQCGYVKWRGQ